VELRFLYLGTRDIDGDLARWLLLPQARLRWRFRHFGADVAAVDLGPAPMVLLADHRPAGSILPIYAVDNLDTEVGRLSRGGWHLEIGPVGTPEGPATVMVDGSGTHVALLQVDRPGALDGAYASADNPRAVR
jgi:hypothetical protein